MAEVPKGDPTLAKTLVSLKAMMKILKKGREGYLVEFGEMAVNTLEEEIPQEVQSLLDQFLEVQVAVKGLPPRRTQDHAVEIKPNAQPPNIRPYRYPHSQKEEIERMVREMLSAGRCYR